MVNPNSKMTVAEERIQYIKWMLMITIMIIAIYLAPQFKDTTCRDTCITSLNHIDYVALKAERYNTQLCECELVHPDQNKSDNYYTKTLYLVEVEP